MSAGIGLMRARQIDAAVKATAMALAPAQNLVLADVEQDELFALCEDGTVWAYCEALEEGNGNAGWTKLSLGTDGF